MERYYKNFHLNLPAKPCNKSSIICPQSYKMPCCNHAHSDGDVDDKRFDVHYVS
jgi:hypothetical protein